MGKKDKSAPKSGAGTIQPVKLEEAWSIWTITVPDEITDLVGPLEGDPLELYEDFKTYLRAAMRDQGKNKMIIDERYTSADQLAILCDASYSLKEVEKNFGLSRIVAIANMARAQRLAKVGETADGEVEVHSSHEDQESAEEADGEPAEKTTTPLSETAASETGAEAHSG